MRATLPSLKEKKRYLVFEAICRSEIAAEEIFKAISNSFERLFGTILLAKAAPVIMEELYGEKKGIIQLNRGYVDLARAGIALVNDSRFLLRSIYVSGTLKSAMRR